MTGGRRKADILDRRDGSSAFADAGELNVRHD
jgi:hypothetical protein